MQLKTKGYLKYAGGLAMGLGFLTIAASLAAIPFTFGMSLLGMIPGMVLIPIGSDLMDSGKRNIALAEAEVKHASPPNKSEPRNSVSEKPEPEGKKVPFNLKNHNRCTFYGKKKDPSKDCDSSPPVQLRVHR